VWTSIFYCAFPFHTKISLLTLTEFCLYWYYYIYIYSACMYLDNKKKWHNTAFTASISLTPAWSSYWIKTARRFPRRGTCDVIHVDACHRSQYETEIARSFPRKGCMWRQCCWCAIQFNKSKLNRKHFRSNTFMKSLTDSVWNVIIYFTQCYCQQRQIPQWQIFQCNTIFVWILTVNTHTLRDLECLIQYLIKSN
jgi:hypothetical protein